MRLATTQQVARLDELCRTQFGYSEETLMEAAGVAASREIGLSYLPKIQKGQVVIVCGPGNNGADGLVVARHLNSGGHKNILVVILGPLPKSSSLFKLQLARVKKQKIPILEFNKPNEQESVFGRATIIVDALLGIGLNREVSGLFAEVISAMNRSKAPKVSLDVPSGLDADRGTLRGMTVRASMTLTFGLAKPGFFCERGPGAPWALESAPHRVSSALNARIGKYTFLV